MRSPHAYSSHLHPKSWEELSLAKEHYTSFLIVRDPLDRLISCYRDKMVTNTHWSLANFRKQVKQRARKIKEGRQRRETEEANSKLEEKQLNSKIHEKDGAVRGKKMELLVEAEQLAVRGKKMELLVE